MTANRAGVAATIQGGLKAGTLAPAKSSAQTSSQAARQRRTSRGIAIGTFVPIAYLEASTRRTAMPAPAPASGKSKTMNMAGEPGANPRDSWIFRPRHGKIRPMTLHRLSIAAVVCALAVSMGCERKSTSATQATTGDILVGLYGSLTGDGASFGISSREGAQLAVDQMNDAGGLLGGRKIKLLVEDDQSKPEEASNAVTKLITQDKVVGGIGEVASRRSLAAGPVCQRYQTPMVSPASTNERVTEIGDYIFRVCFIDPFQGEVLAKFAFNDLKAKKIAVLKDIQQDYSVGLTDAIVKTFTRLGGQVLD